MRRRFHADPLMTRDVIGALEKGSISAPPPLGRAGFRRGRQRLVNHMAVTMPLLLAFYPSETAFSAL
jgi:hypothetical protein